MYNSNKIGIIAEGKAEMAIFKILQQNNLLNIPAENILINNPSTTRNAKTYCERNLKMVDEVTIIRILDSKKENFNIPKAYKNKIVEVINVYTRPEIEMLIIHAEGLYSQYKSSRNLPNVFLKTYDKKFKQCKSKSFIDDYFSDPNKLYDAIIEYERITNIKGEGFTQILK